MKKVTYTIPKELLPVLDELKNDWKISKSKIVESCIINGFKLMEEELHDKNTKPIPKKQSNSKPITLNISDYVCTKLEYYSKKLDIKKSHLVYASIIYSLFKTKEDREQYDKEIEEFSEIVLDVYRSTI